MYMKFFIIKAKKFSGYFLALFCLNLLQLMELSIIPSKHFNFYWQESPGFSLIFPSISFQPPRLHFLRREQKGLFLDAPHLSPKLFRIVSNWLMGFLELEKFQEKNNYMVNIQILSPFVHNALSI